MRRWSCWCVIVLSLAATATARDIYVNNQTGQDIASGERSTPDVGTAGPVRTIAKSLRLARAGDRIVIANTGQAYQESVVLFGERHSGSAVEPLVIEGNDAVIDGSAPIRADAWQFVSGETFACQPTQLGFQRLFVDGRLSVAQPMSHGDEGVPLLQPLESAFSGKWLYFRVEKGHLPDDYRLACCRLRTGLTLSFVDNVVIRDLTIQGFQWDGIRAIDSVRRARFENVNSLANGRSGLSVGGAAWVYLDRCKLADNGASQVRGELYSHARLVNCDVDSTTAPAVIDAGGEIWIGNSPDTPASTQRNSTTPRRR